MSVLVPSTTPVQEGIAILADIEHVQISKVVWEALELEGENAAVAVTPLGLPVSRIFPALVCWAIRSDMAEFVVLPHGALESCSGFRSPKDDKIQVSVTSIQPIPLDEVILLSKTRAAFTFAQENREQIEHHLVEGRRIIRQGEAITVHQDLGHKYEVVMTLPVHQGYVDPGTTQILVAAERTDGDEDVSASPPSSESETSEDAGSEIDENFLIHSGLGARADSPNLENTNMLVNGATTVFKCTTIHPETSDGFEDATALVHTGDLARLGAFSGDWVVLSNLEDRSLDRVAKVIGQPYGEPGLLAIPPLLLHNLSTGHSNPQFLAVRKCPFGQKKPPTPVARSVTLARIASPISVQKRYQPLVLKALREYFQVAKRVLKNGDMVAMPISTSSAPLLDGLIENEAKRSNMDFAEDIFDQLPVTQTKMDAVAHFRVTHLDYDIVPIDGDDDNDNHFAAVMGELGCWIDPESTRLAQGGLENSLVPNLDEYLQLDGSYPRLVAKIRDSVLCTSGSSFSQIRDLLLATLHPAALSYSLGGTILLSGSRGIGKRTLVRWAAQDLGLHILEVDCYNLVEDTDVKTEGSLRARFDQAKDIAPSVILLRNIDALGRSTQRLETGKEPTIIVELEKCISSIRSAWTGSGYPTIVVATVRDMDALPLSAVACFKHQIQLNAPGEAERLAILDHLLRDSPLGADVSLQSVATQTAALVADDLVDLASRVQTAAARRISETSARLHISVKSLLAAGYSLTGADFELGLTQARSSFSASIGAPSIPKVSWDDVGGLSSVKADILDTIQLPLEHPELFADGIKKRSGILLFGPPGTGKTLLAKAVATSFSLNFFSVKGPELLNMYIGESEANVRRVFQRARDARPCVIFFDELDSVAPKRGNHGDSGGVMDRIVSQLLAELDGMSSGSGGDIFVIGATNRPDLLDPALLRPGRFDKLLYLGVSDTHDAQLRIIEALTRKFQLDPQLDLRAIAEQCPFNYTGADFYALCSDAMLKAMARKATAVDAKIAFLNSQPALPTHVYPLTPQYYLAEMATQEDTEVVVAQEDFLAALRELVPSVSQIEMEHYRQVQKRFAENSTTGDN